MLLFRSEEDVDDWCGAHDMPRGHVMTLDQVWTLSRLWYGDRLSPDYRGRDAKSVEALFVQVGLTGPFWRLG